MDALLSLEEPYRATLLWRYHAGLPLAEIAARQNVPVETVRTRIQRGLARLRDHLDRTHPGGRSAWMAALLPLGTGSEGGAAPVERVGPFPAAGVPAVATVGGVIGGLVVKKVAIVAGLVALLGAGAVVVVRAAGSGSGSEPGASAPTTVDLAPVPAGMEPPSLAASGRATMASTSGAGSAAPATASERGRLRVRVLGPEGKAVEGAVVRIAPGVETLPHRRWEREVPGTKQATADASGVAFEVPTARYAVQVRAQGLRPVDLEPIEVAANQTAERQVSLDEGVVVHVRLFDDKKGPLSHATVYAGGPLASLAEGVTDGEGRCTLRGIAPPTPAMLRSADYWTGRIFFRVIAQGFVTLDWSAECPKTIGPVSFDLAMRRGTIVRVRVSSSDGPVIPEVQVAVENPGNVANPIEKGDPVVGPGTDGWAVLPPLAPGSRTIRVSGGNRQFEYAAVTKIVEVGETPMDLEVTLDPLAEARLEGQVLLPDGSPAPSLGVHFLPTGEDGGGWSTPTAVLGGRFSLEHLRVGRGALRVYVPGYLRQSFPIDVASSNGPITLQLKDGPRLTGRVVDRKGLPVSGVPVTAWQSLEFANGSKSTTCLGEVTPGNDGKFSFVIGDGAPEHLQAQSATWIPTTILSTAEFAVAGSEVTLVVKPASEGSGLPLVLRIVDPRGLAVEGRVSLQWKSGGGTRSASAPAALPDGRLRFGVWGDAGIYDFELSVTGYRLAHLCAIRIEDTAAPETHDVLLDRGGIINLRVLDATGKPWARHAFHVGEQNQLLTTDVTGGIELAGSDPGPVPQIRVSDTEDTSGSTNGILKRAMAPGSYDVVVERCGYVAAALPWTYDETPAGAFAELLDEKGRVLDREDLKRWPGAGNHHPAKAYLRAVADGPVSIRVTGGEQRLTGTVTARVGETVEATVAP